MPTTTDGGGTTIVLGNGQNGSSGTDWTDWARLALGAYQALKKPSFSQQPMSPEQKKIYQLYLDNLMNPAYKDLGPEVVARAKGMTDRLGAGSWTSPKTFSGDVGYSGSGGGFGGSGGVPPWATSAATNKTYPGQDKLLANPTLAPGVMRETDRAMLPNIQQWEPVGDGKGGGFPLSPTMPQYDPNKEVTLDPNHWITRNNPATAGGPQQNADGSFSKGNAPPGMSYSPGPGELPGFIQFMRNSGMKDAAKIAIGFFSGGLLGAELALAKTAWDHYQASKKKGGG